MPLHDWSDLAGWEGVHLLWIAELLRQIKAELPTGFRAYLGSGPALAVGVPPARPDVSVRTVAGEQRAAEASRCGIEPDEEVAVATLETDPALLIERQGRLVAALELVSPRNKDRPLARTTYGRRYAGYLIEGVNLLVVDVHPRPVGVSFADIIAGELQMQNEPLVPPPMAVAYRVGEPAATGGRMLAIWRHPLKAREKFPSVALWFAMDKSVPVDLENTYMCAAADAYLT